jgi:hypothetical protein
MTSTVSIFIQVLATILQVLNAVNVTGLPVKWQAAFTGLLTVGQAVVGTISHYYTPAGTSLAAPGTTVTTPATGTVLAK